MQFTAEFSAVLCYNLSKAIAGMSSDANGSAESLRLVQADIRLHEVLRQLYC
jgi:hypothetical protein